MHTIEAEQFGRAGKAIKPDVAVTAFAVERCDDA